MPVLPRVVDAAEVRHQGTAAEGELVQIRFAQENGARRFEPTHHLGILSRDTVFENAASCRRPHAGCVEEIL